jgi:WD40 repeat protein
MSSHPVHTPIYRPLADNKLSSHPVICSPFRHQNEVWGLAISPLEQPKDYCNMSSHPVTPFPPAPPLVDNRVSSHPVICSPFRHQNEVWGLAVSPLEQPKEYCTVGDDGTLRIWDVRERRQVDLLQLAGPARAVAYSPDGKLIAVSGLCRAAVVFGSEC